MVSSFFIVYETFDTKYVFLALMILLNFAVRLQPRKGYGEIKLNY